MDLTPYALVDPTQESLVFVTFTGENSTDDNFQQYLDDLEKCYDDRKKISIIFDASKAVIPNLSHQKKQAFWISQNWKMIQNYCQGTAYVIPNLAIRAVLKIIFSFQNQPAPYKIFSTMTEAKLWIQQITAQEKENSD